MAIWKCEICGRIFKRFTSNHVRSHGLLNRAEYNDYLKQLKAPAPTPDIISQVATCILKGQEIPENLTVALSKVQQQVASRANALFDVATIKRTNRLARLLSAMDNIDNNLLDSDRIANMSFADLMKLSALVNDHSKELYDELDERPRTATSQSVGNVFINNNPVPVGIPEDPRARTQLMSNVRRLIRDASEVKVFEPKVPKEERPIYNNGTKDKEGTLED